MATKQFPLRYSIQCATPSKKRTTPLKVFTIHSARKRDAIAVAKELNKQQKIVTVIDWKIQDDEPTIYRNW